MDGSERKSGEAVTRAALTPDEMVQKILFSATTHFVGDLKTENFQICHAWPAFHTGRRDWFGGTGPLSRTAFIVSFRTTAPINQPGFIVPNYERGGHIVASALSVLFGKRFDVHGPTEMSGHFNVPDLSQFTTPINPNLPHNSGKPRTDYPFPLNIEHASRISALIFDDHPNQKGQAAFLNAARFYQRALQAVEDDPEIAYLHLITAGEIIADHKPFIEAEHIDPAALKALASVREGLPDGERIARLLQSRIRGIKRRFVSTIVGYAGEDFFAHTEAENHFDGFKKATFRQTIEAAYDLRSRNIHTGQAFGMWIAPRHGNAEIQHGEPIVKDRKQQRTLARAPLFAGLERAIRVTLLGFAAELGCDLFQPEGHAASEGEGCAIPDPVAD